MTAEQIQELFTEVSCYACLGLTSAQLLQLALMRRWLLALNPSADVSVAGLMKQASCFLCFTNGSMFDLLELALLQGIQEAL